MSDLIQRLKGLYSVGEKDGVIYEDRDFGNFTPKINLEAVALIEAQKEEIAELKARCKIYTAEQSSMRSHLQKWQSVFMGLESKRISTAKALEKMDKLYYSNPYEEKEIDK